jgi:hypothetical protein
MHWLRARFSSDSVTLSANLLFVLVYVLMALVRKTVVFVVFSALAGVGWTISASELWVAAQRAMPSWARGRMNATVIMISQGAMVLGGSDLGFGWCNSRNKLYLAWSSGSVPDEPAFGPSALNQCYKQPRRNSLSPFIWRSPTSGGRSHIAGSLNDF